MFILFLVFQQFVWKPKPVAQTQQDPQAQQTTPSKASSDSLPKPVIALPDSLIKSDVGLATITLSNQVMSVSFSNAGAVITQVEMKDHKVDKPGRCA